MLTSRRSADQSHRSGLRTVDVARRVGCSVQHLRELEREGVVPTATRTSSGYRSWSETHVLCAVAYRELAQGVGPAPAKELLRALHRQPPAVFLAQLDDSHADLARERRDLWLARQAVAAIAAEPLAAPQPSDAMTISELAEALGNTPATLRHWEAKELLLRSEQDAVRSAPTRPRRSATPAVIHQLRTAGYSIPQLRPVLRTLLQAQDNGAALETGLAVRDQQLTNRSHALLRASAALRDVLAANTNTPDNGADEPSQGGP